MAVDESHRRSQEARRALDGILQPVTDLSEPVGSGVVQGREARALASKAVEAVVRASDMTQQNAAAAEEMAAGAHEVGVVLDQIADAAGGQSAMTTALNDEVVRLRDLASELKTLMGQFETDDVSAKPHLRLAA